MDIEQKITLLKISRKTIELYLEERKKLKISKEDYSNKEFWEEKGTFVTITENGDLRGCIGTIYPVRPLILDIVDNSINAAFRDPRFYPLEKEELSLINIEISILSVPEKIHFKNEKELFNIVKPNIHGVIIRKGFYQATFLPQVWEELPKPEDFFSQLCLKAGLNKNCYKDPTLDVEIYTVEAFSESEINPKE